MKPLRVWTACGAVLVILTLQACRSRPPAEGESDLVPAENTILPTRQVEAITKILNDRLYRTWRHDSVPRSNDIRLTGPFIIPGRTKTSGGYGTHARVTIYYSSGVVTWLENGRLGDIADGSMIVKEMYVHDPGAAPQLVEKLQGWAVMLRDGNASHDGWLWYLYYLPGNIYYPPAASKPVGQYAASFCLACHASADTDQLTFSFLGNLTNDGVATYTYFDNSLAPNGTLEPAVDAAENIPSGHAAMMAAHSGTRGGTGSADETPLPSPNQAIVALRDGRSLPAKDSIQTLPGQLFSDHVVSGAHGPEQFLTSDACSGCHDVSNLLNNKLPNMAIAGPDNVPYNVSPYGEWSASLMGLAGRDPVFLAQLESEQEQRPAYAAEIANFCLGCHAAMGARQFHLDRGDDVNFPVDVIYATPDANDAKYGALARDGVSCTVCHHVSPDGLGTVATFNGLFATGPPDRVYGPFSEPKTYPMEQAIGVTPVRGNQLQHSGLCGSCHTVLPPKIPLNGDAASSRPFAEFPVSHEQTTYLEWLNSSYNDQSGSASEAKGCTACHMPDTFGTSSDPLSFKIANIEGPDFPALPNRAPDELVTLEARSPYRRHALNAINLFTLTMFEQFAGILGVTVPDIDYFTFRRSRLSQAREQGLEMASAQTARISIEAADETGGNLDVHVTVKNLAGHKLPTGVGFRRMFVQLSVLDTTGGLLWSSGRTGPGGVLVDENNQPLVSEFTTDWRDLQPSYDVIIREDQVQIYETRHVNDRGELTTSFLGLFEEMKDNRILPKGWSPEGPYHEVTAPVELGGEPIIRPQDLGIDRLIYRVPLARIRGWHTVRAQLFYQALPPYYLRDRFIAEGAATDRLYYLAAHLNLVGTPMEEWRLLVASTDVSVGL